MKKTLLQIPLLFFLLYISHFPPTPTPGMSLREYYRGPVPPATHRHYPSVRKPFHNYQRPNTIHYGVGGRKGSFYWYMPIR